MKDYKEIFIVIAILTLGTIAFTAATTLISNGSVYYARLLDRDR